jgi:ABC-2 type transport system ATP-binding protein
MTCERVIIINEGKMVASDTPENLTRRLKGSESIFIEVSGPKSEMESKIKKLKGVTRVTRKESVRTGEIGFTVETALNSDIRTELAACIVNNGWGLLEMRPVGMSLEEIFLHLTTKEEEVS